MLLKLNGQLGLFFFNDFRFANFAGTYRIPALSLAPDRECFERAFEIAVQAQFDDDGRRTPRLSLDR